MKKCNQSSVSRALIFVLFLCFNHLVNSQEFPVEILSIEQINFIEPFQIENSASAEVTINYNIPVGEPITILNIVAKTELPQVDDVWWGQNIMLNPFQNPVNMKVILDLHPLGGLPGLDFNEIQVAIILTDRLIFNLPSIPVEEFTPVLITNTDYIVGNGVNISAGIDLIGLIPFNLSFNPAIDTNWIYRGCEVPNIDLDDSTYPMSIDNQGNVEYLGDMNACAQASLANSFSWLESQHPEINTGKTTREIVQQLDSEVGRSLTSGAPDMKGVIEGALDFIDSNKVPISVKFQCLGLNSDVDSPNSDYGHSAENQGTDPQNPGSNQVTWDFIKSEMEAGEDVTLVYSNWDGTTWTSSHAVTVTGVSKDPNNKKLTYKDDSDQLTAGGTSEKQIDVRELDGWLVTNQLAGGPGNQIITAVVSKSYDPSVTFEDPVFKDEELLSEFYLKQNYPNPFNPTTTIEYSIPRDGFVSIKIFNELGEILETLVQQIQLKGIYQFHWNAKKYSSGVYFCRLEFAENTHLIKMLIIK